MGKGEAMSIWERCYEVGEDAWLVLREWFIGYVCILSGGKHYQGWFTRRYKW
jgi:hypothetical protein